VRGHLLGQLGLAADDKGWPVIRDQATSVEGVFAAGDLVTGPSYVAVAIASGRKAAERIVGYLARARD